MLKDSSVEEDDECNTWLQISVTHDHGPTAARNLYCGNGHLLSRNRALVSGVRLQSPRQSDKARRLGRWFPRMARTNGETQDTGGRKSQCRYLKLQSADSLPKAIRPAAYRHSA
jgi:hypothetical protein